jgi:F-type H+-transporting ATPase subunit delta
MGKETISHPYAKGAFEYAMEHNSLPEWRVFLTNLALFCNDSSLQDYISRPGLSFGDFSSLWEIFESIFKETLVAENLKAFYNFFRLLVEYRRLDLVPDIQMVFESLCAEKAKIIFAEVTSAKPLTASQQNQIKAALKIRFSSSDEAPQDQREVELNYQEDPSLLAGLRIKVGDWTFDNTLSGRFNRLKNQLENI